MLYCTYVWRCQRNIWTTWAYSVFGIKLKPQEITFITPLLIDWIEFVTSLANYVLL